jgi:hypothetical protein
VKVSILGSKLGGGEIFKIQFSTFGYEVTKEIEYSILLSGYKCGCTHQDKGCYTNQEKHGNKKRMPEYNGRIKCLLKRIFIIFRVHL